MLDLLYPVASSVHERVLEVEPVILVCTACNVLFNRRS